LAFAAIQQQQIQGLNEKSSMQLRITDLETSLENQKQQTRCDALTIKLCKRQINALQGDVEYLATGNPNDVMGQITVPSHLLANNGEWERDPAKRREKYNKMREERALQLERKGEEKVAMVDALIEKMKALSINNVEEKIGDDFVRSQFQRQVLKRPQRLPWGEERPIILLRRC
jgi:hypothetical protein